MHGESVVKKKTNICYNMPPYAYRGVHMDVALSGQMDN